MLNNIIFIFVLTFSLYSCSLFFQLQTPIPKLYLTAKSKNFKYKKTLIIFLPGFFDEPSDFLEQGFFRSTHKVYPEINMVALDAHIGYYNNHILWDRLNNEIIDPAIKKGYENIWMVGISMGGMGAMTYIRKNPDKLTGVLLLAPDLGSDALY